MFRLGFAERHHPLNLLQRRHSIAHQIQSIFLHRLETVVARQRPHLIIPISGPRGLSNGLVEMKDFVDAHPPAIAAEITLVASVSDHLDARWLRHSGGYQGLDVVGRWSRRAMAGA